MSFTDKFIPQRSTLKKEIGRIGFFCLAFGAMIGVGWVTAMGPLGSAIAFAAGGILILFIGFCFSIPGQALSGTRRTMDGIRGDNRLIARSGGHHPSRKPSPCWEYSFGWPPGKAAKRRPKNNVIT